MTTLPDVQKMLLHGILAGESVAGLVVSDELSADDRLCIYRNTYISGLTNALRITFPAVHRLVGADFFEGLAQGFIAAHPPTSAYLNDYGARLGDFIAGFEPAASLPYLGDVARLEWAVNCALHAPDEMPLDPAALTEVPLDIRFTVQSSISLSQPNYPVDAIWNAVLAEDDAALAAIDLSEGSVRLFVSRDAGVVTVTRMNETAFAFTAALCRSEALDTALELGGEDGIALLAQHLAMGRLTALI